MSIRILVVDDNPDILANVRDFLSMKDGWAPETASTGLEALERIDRSTFDLVILDVGLPDTDGMTLTRRLRASGFTAPILMLTARDTIDDRVEGLTSGADDYLIKPFSLRELAARVEALLRRSGANPAGHLTAGPLSLDLKTLRVEREGRDIRLNPTCLQLLRELMQQSPGIVSRRRLEAVLWQGEPPASAQPGPAHHAELRAPRHLRGWVLRIRALPVDRIHRAAAHLGHPQGRGRQGGRHA